MNQYVILLSLEENEEENEVFLKKIRRKLLMWVWRELALNELLQAISLSEWTKYFHFLKFWITAYFSSEFMNYFYQVTTSVSFLHLKKNSNFLNCLESEEVLW